MVTALLSNDDLSQARALLQACGLRYEPPFDDLVGVIESGRLVAVGARDGRVLKMLAVTPELPGDALLGEVLDALVDLGLQEGFDSCLVFAAPELTASFQALGCNLLAASAQSALLEYGDGLRHYLARHQRLVTPGDHGAVVATCNPFTFGHRHLIEQAAACVEQLYLFVVRRERSLFPFEHRFRMAREGTCDLPNVTLLDTCCYAVSSAGFPTYYLKEGDPGGAVQMELDLLLFASRIAPHFRIGRRFVGSPPPSPGTARYHAAMHRILPAFGIGVTELERVGAGGAASSAAGVRERLARGEAEGLATLVPESTRQFLLSREGRRVWDRADRG